MRGSRQAFDQYAVEHPQFRAEANLTPLLTFALEGAPDGRPVIDLGCGEGGTLDALRQHLNRPALGVELSFVRAAIAHDRTHAVVVADGLALPYAPGAASVVVSRHVIEHVDDDEGLLCEMRRLLCQRGRLYLETPLRLRGAWYFYRNHDGQRTLDPTHVREYKSSDEVARLVERAGFRILRIDTAPIRFPVGELLARLLTVPWRAARPHGHVPDRLLRSRATVRVPRYREIRLAAEAS